MTRTPPHLLILGCGYSGTQIARRFAGRVSGTVRSHARAQELTKKYQELVENKIEPILYAGGAPTSALNHALSTATHLLISIPPTAAAGSVAQALAAAIRAAPHLVWIGYLSSISVYGQQKGGWVDETTPACPTSARGHERLKAEQDWQAVAQGKGCAFHIFRLAGIYGPGQNALENLRSNTARCIIKPDQVFNRIHIADIAGLVLAGMTHPQAGSIFNGSDHEPAPPQDVVCFAANLLGSEPPPSIAFEDAQMTPMARSFYSENKRVCSLKTRRALFYTFQYPTYREGLTALKNQF